MRSCRLIAVLALAVWLCGVSTQAAASSADILVASASDSKATAAESLEIYDPLFDDDELDMIDASESDPFENGNRLVFAFNEDLDCWLLDPITRTYQFLVPVQARRLVNQFFENLNAPVSFTNEVLQLRPRAASVTLVRFVSNSTIGVVGLFDPADTWFGLAPSEADFGQTLARYGIPSGPYLVVPLFGPSTARDTVGTVIDQVLNPLTYVAGPLNFQWRLLLGGGKGLSLKESNRTSIEGLRGSSVDFYAALRSAYLQSRHAVEREATARPAEIGSSAP